MTAIISLTTIPDRIEHIEPCVRSLVKQGLPIYLWIVRKIARSKTTLKRIPPFLKRLGVNIEIVEDCGPITKLLPALKAGFEIVLTADDDRFYGKGWARDLLEFGAVHTNAALGYRGRKFKGARKYNQSRVVWNPKKPTKVDLITGCRGAMYRSDLFDAGIFDEWKRWPRNDDIVISAHLKRRGIPIVILPCHFRTKPTAAYNIRPLFGENAHSKRLNDEGLRRMMWS